MGYLLQATADHAHDLCSHLREADRAEVAALTGAPPELILPAQATNASAMFSSKGELVGLCGCDPVQHFPEVGIIWMIGSNRLVRHRVEFLRAGRSWVIEQHRRFPLLTNRADARNTLHLRWLSWLGFRFLREVERWGAQGRPFIEFASYKDNFSPCALQLFP